MKCECGNNRYSVEYQQILVGTAFVDENGDVDDHIEDPINSTGLLWESNFKCTRCKKEYEELD